MRAKGIYRKFLGRHLLARHLLARHLDQGWAGVCSSHFHHKVPLLLPRRT